MSVRTDQHQPGSPGSEEEAPGDIQALDVRVRGEHGAWTTVPFRDASAVQIRESVRLLQQAKRPGRSTPSDWQNKAQALAEALPPPPQGLRRHDRVQLHRGTDGRLAVSIRAVGIDELAALVQALQAHLMS